MSGSGGSLGSGGGGGSTSEPNVACQELADPAPLQRLSVLDINRTLDDVLGPGTTLELDEPNGRAADPALQASTPLIEALRGVALARAAELATDLATPEAMEAFLDEAGPRLYRRPLSDDERAAYASIIEANPENALEELLVALLLSPYFVWRVELGEVEASGNEIPLTPYEIAARLSYFLWRAPPDDFLRESAAEGRLSDPGTLSIDLFSMLADEKAKFGLERLHVEWLGLERLPDKALERGLSSELAADMAEQTRRFIDYYWERDDRRLATLLTSTHGDLNGALASHYGIAGISGGFREVELDSTRFAGILTHGSVLVSYPTPSARGTFVRKRLLCESIAEQPPDLPPLPVAPATRESLEAETASPACRGCHVLLDPPGFAFEDFDALGAPQAGDSSGTLTGIEGEPSFDGAPELARILAELVQTRDCVASRWFNYAFDRPVDFTLESQLGCVIEDFRDTDGDLALLVEDIVLSRAFGERVRRASSLPAAATETRALDHAMEEIENLLAVIAQDDDVGLTDRVALDGHLAALRELANDSGAGGEGGSPGAGGGGS